MILMDGKLDFKSIEKNVFEEVCELGRDMIKSMVIKLDKELMNNRDKEKYRHKGLKRTSVKTLLGTIEFKRAIYKSTEEDGRTRFVYLLDEHLNMGISGDIQYRQDKAQSIECRWSRVG